MKKQADWNFADMKRMAIDDFKLQRERTFLNGVRTVTTIRTFDKKINVHSFECIRIGKS
jgi:hypothetical protein